MFDRKSFVLYMDFKDQFSLLELTDRGVLISMIFDYVESGRIYEEVSPVVMMAFVSIKNVLDRDSEKYAAICERNAKNGKKGDRPRKHSLPDDAYYSEKTERFFEKPKKADSESDSDNDNESDNDSDIDSGSESDSDNELSRKEHCSAGPGSAQLTEKEKEILFSRGVPEEYIEDRLDRAIEHSTLCGRRVSYLLLSWWKRDKPAWQSASSPENEKSFDTDEFFEAARQRAFREINSP